LSDETEWLNNNAKKDKFLFRTERGFRKFKPGKSRERQILPVNNYVTVSVVNGRTDGVGRPLDLLLLLLAMQVKRKLTYICLYLKPNTLDVFILLINRLLLIFGCVILNSNNYHSSLFKLCTITAHISNLCTLYFHHIWWRFRSRLDFDCICTFDRVQLWERRKWCAQYCLHILYNQKNL
jgi:hypothetical protein